MNPALPIDYRQKKTKEAPTLSGLSSKPCIICQKMCEGYGQWSTGQTCSRTCENIQKAKPLYPGHGDYS